MEAASSKKGYLCPECRLLLSAVPRMAGKRTVCPGCGTALLVPRGVDMVTPLGVELATKTQTARKNREGFDVHSKPKDQWQIELPKEILAVKASVMPWFTLIPAAVLGVVLVIAVILMMMGTTPRPAERVDGLAEAKSVNYQGFSEADVESFLEQIAEASSIDLLLPHLRKVENLERDVRAYYQSRPWKPFVYDKVINFGEMASGIALNFSARSVDGDLRDGVLFIEGDSLLLDWHAFVGYSEKSAKQIIAEKPTAPTLVRVFRSRGEYYNLGFDSDQWQAFELRFADSEETLIGYAPRDGALHVQLLPIGEQEGTKAVTLKIRYSEDVKRDNLVIIDSMLSDTWVLDHNRQ